MRTTRKINKVLLGGGLVFLLALTSVSHTVAQTCVQPPSGITGWWPGDGNTKDIVGGRNAVLRDNATTGPGFVGDAFLLDGAGDFVDVPHDPALNVGSGDFTVDLWVLFNSTAGEQVLVEKYVENFSGNAPGWSFAKLANNALVVAPNSPQTPPLSLLPNTWYHFAARRSSGNITIFVNGTPMASGPLGSGGNVNTTSSLKFGHRGGPSDTPGSSDTRGFFLNGRIDEVELFVGRALSDAEILAIFNAGSAGKCKCAAPPGGGSLVAPSNIVSGLSCGPAAAVPLRSWTDEVNNKFELFCQLIPDPDAAPEFHLKYNGRRVGRCPWASGRNFGAVVHAGDSDGDGKFNCFLGSFWRSREPGTRQGVAGGQDWKTYTFNRHYRV
jgi:concanavalin A-like lectin/glucanase superfamily protein